MDSWYECPHEWCSQQWPKKEELRAHLNWDHGYGPLKVDRAMEDIDDE